jgi:transposase
MDVHKHSTQTERLDVVETGRRRWSDDEKLRIVLESLETPRAISATARRHGISRSLLMTWRRASRPEPIGPKYSRAASCGRWLLPVRRSQRKSSASTTGRMVIEIGKDLRIIVDAGVDAAALARVLAILERR